MYTSTTNSTLTSCIFKDLIHELENQRRRQCKAIPKKRFRRLTNVVTCCFPGAFEEPRALSHGLIGSFPLFGACGDGGPPEENLIEGVCCGNGWVKICGFHRKKDGNTCCVEEAEE